MTEQEWLSSSDVGRMLGWITGQPVWTIPPPSGISDRKLRLLACACDLNAAGGAPPWWLADVLGAIDDPGGHAVPRVMRDRFVNPVQWVRMYFQSYPCEAASRNAALLRDVIGNPFRPVPPLCGTGCPDPGEGYHGPGCVRTTTVLGLARAAYDGHDGGLLPILADALEDAGCTDAATLSHCRGPGPHVRGCWALDLLLEKE